jgi:hypothetical protein
MKYLYWDLGEQQQDSQVVAHLRGLGGNVILLDPVNFDRYRHGLPFHYTGGLHTRTPVGLEVPHDGHWYLVIDCGGYRHQVEVKKIQILPPEGSPTTSEADSTFAGAAA